VRRVEAPHRAERLELAAHEPRAARRVAGPQVAEGARRGVRHAHRLEAEMIRRVFRSTSRTMASGAPPAQAAMARA
jgi:hypothetical protein